MSRTPLPTEADIRAAAKRLGLADEHGNYPQADRPRIARAIQDAAREATAAADTERDNTAHQLYRLELELYELCVAPDARARILGAAAEHLLRKDGLTLRPLQPREDTTP